MDYSMDLLICAGDVIRLSHIRDTIEDIMEAEGFSIPSIEEVGVFAVETKHGDRKEEMVYMLPHCRGMDETDRLRALMPKIVRKLSLTKRQVVYADIYYPS